MNETISTAVTELFGIEKPILLAGMNVGMYSLSLSLSKPPKGN